MSRAYGDGVRRRRRTGHGQTRLSVDGVPLGTVDARALPRLPETPLVRVRDAAATATAGGGALPVVADKSLL